MTLHEFLQFARAGFAGGLFVMFVVEVLLFSVRRRTVHAMGAALLFMTAALMIARIFIYEPNDPELNRTATRVVWTVLFLFGTGMVGALRSVSQTPFGKATYGTFATGAIGAFVVWFDGPIITHGHGHLTEITGNVVQIVHLSPTAAIFIVPHVVLLLVELFNIARNADFRVARQSWRALTFASIVIVVGAVVEILQVAGFFHFVGTVEFSLGIVTFAMLFVFANYTARAYSVLEQDVEQATAALAATIDSLRGLISGLPDLVLVERGERVEPYNDRARTAFGDEALSVDSLAANPEAAAQLRELFANATSDPTFARIELETLDGPQQVDLVAVAASLDDQRIVIANGRDTRERDQLERQLRLADRLSSLGTMAAGVAHEINNPVAYISANLEYCIAEMGDDPEREDEIEAIKAAIGGTQRVARIVKDLGTFARYESESADSPGDVEHAFEIAMGIARSTLRHTVEIDADIADNLPLVGVDTGQLSQVILNLLINAGDAMPEGRANADNQVRILARRDGDRVRVEVRDNGVGMTPADVERIFDPFFTTKEVGQGTGLGMSICHAIIEQAGGTITVESTLGEGTTSIVELPTAKLAEQLVESSDSTEVSGVRLLLIDDDPMVLKATMRLLALNHDVQSACSAAEAISLLESQDFDAIICDVMMPDMNGLEFFDWLNANRPELSRRFIYFTGGAIGGSIQKALTAAGSPIISKPLEQEQLNAVLDELKLVS